ncbi:MAG: hypothetical protein JWN39_1051 [Ilumatobacteraceae bacterium]|nr:hypothetical protein [Ilumatobacteraceae bacterium]
MSLTSVSVARLIPSQPFETLADYLAVSPGGEGLRAARLVEREVVIAELEASGLRGRGGAGFPTGTKWRTVVSFESAALATSVVVNAAEGEPGTFKDRTILLANPYAVIEGALIAARVVGARSVTIATKQRFTDVVARVRAAIDEIRGAGWLHDPAVGEIEMTVVEGPAEYLYGEETALLEVLDGRPPFPRIAPPWRRGLVEVVADDQVDSGSGLSAHVDLAVEADDNVAPPVLVDNVETLANVAGIVALGASWFRSVGTEQSPGTIVCTVTGAVSNPAVIEVPMGMPLRAVLESAMRDLGQPAAEHAAGPVNGLPGERSIRCVLMGVSNAILTSDELDLPISYEAMRARGTGLGSASFIVVDDSTHPAAVAAGASRFLAVESGGQCTACKQDGLEISGLLASMVAGTADPTDLGTIATRLDTVVGGARCSLATQHQTVVRSIFDAFPDAMRAQAAVNAEPVAPYLVAELLGIDGATATVDESFADKQPDWTSAGRDSGQAPAERLDDHRQPLDVEGEST